jgi:esterase
MDLFCRELGSGTPLVILHGLFGSSDNWMSIARVFAEQYRVIIPDLRNHGQSPHSEDWDNKIMAEDLFELFQKLSLDECYLMGHSMGGKVAMEFALEHEEKVKKLIVVDIAPKSYPIHHQKILEGLNSIDLDNLESRKKADELFAEYVPFFAVRAFLLKNLGRDDDGKFYWKLNLPIITEKIEEIGAPLSEGTKFEKDSMFLRGGKSDYILDEDMELAKSFFPKAKLKTIEGAGHWLHAEKPDEYFKVVSEFLG